MALTVGTNSWVTLAEANSYLSEKFGIGTTWSGLADSEKEAALITAYRWIMALSNYSIAPASTATKVKHAQIELALYIVRHYEEHRKREALYSQGVRNFHISKWSESLDKAKLPFEVENLLDDYLIGAGGRFPLFERELGE